MALITRKDESQWALAIAEWFAVATVGQQNYTVSESRIEFCQREEHVVPRTALLLLVSRYVRVSSRYGLIVPRAVPAVFLIHPI